MLLADKAIFVTGSSTGAGRVIAIGAARQREGNAFECLDACITPR